MVDLRGAWVRDVMLRSAGVVLLISCWLIMRWLFHAHAADQRQEFTPLDFAAATTGFFCFSSGAGLISLGAHIFDQVQVSGRWATRRRPSAGGQVVSPPPELRTMRDRDRLGSVGGAAANPGPAHGGVGSGHATG